ncbi:MAG: hypothetical protein P4L75_04500, partial [Clostridia bacterium]|nr:hypothetical protein [Clostridia bacterium]
MGKGTGVKAAVCVAALLVCSAVAYAVFTRPAPAEEGSTFGAACNYAVVIDPGHGGIDGGAV